MYTVYRILNIVTGKSYIGMTKHTFGRLQYHFNSDRSPIYRDLIKYGINSWRILYLQTNISTREEALKIETYYITLFDCVNNGYNTVYFHGFGGHPKYSSGSEHARYAVHRAWEIKGDQLLHERKTRFQDPEKYRKHCEMNSTTKMRQIRSDAMKNFTVDDKHKESYQRMRANIKASLNTPESKIKRSKISEKYDEVLVSRIKSIAAKFKRSNAAIGRAFNIPRPTVNDMVSGRSYTKCQIDDSKLHLVSFSKGEVVISDIKDFYEGC